MKKSADTRGFRVGNLGTAVPLALAATLAVVAGCSHKIEPGERPLTRTSVQAAAVETVAEMPLPAFHDAPGSVRARSMTMVSPRIMAEIEDVAVDEGDRVEKGQLLVRLRSSEMDARLGQARAAAEAAESSLETARRGRDEAQAGRDLARATLARYRKLHEARAVSDQEFETVETQARVAEAALGRMEAGAAVARASLERAREGVREAELYKDFTLLEAPHAGRVIARMADPGTMAAPGVPVLKLAAEGFELEVPLEETMITRLGVGDVVDVAIPSGGLSGKGTIRSVVPAVDQRTRTVQVKIGLPDEWQAELSEGAYGTARITLPPIPRITVPETAVVRKGQLEGVYVVDEGGIVRLRLVRTGRREGARIEILSGLGSGERVVVGDVSGMRDGAAMKPDGDS